MKINKLYLMGILILIILTVGTVNASENNITSDDLSISQDNDEILADYGDWEGYEDNYVITSPELGDIYYLDNDAVIASLELPSDALGNLQVYEDGEFLDSFPLDNGRAVITLGDLNFTNPIGTHFLAFTYESEEWDYSVETLECEITLVGYEFITPKNHSLFGEGASYYLDLHDDVNGTLTLVEQTIDEYDDIEETTSYFEIKNGKVNITITNLILGPHYFIFTFQNGDYDICLQREYWIYPNINVKNTIYIGKDDILSFNLPEDACGEVMFTLYSYNDDIEDEYDVYYEDGDFTLSSIELLPGEYDIISFTMIDEAYGIFVWENSPSYGDSGAFMSFRAKYPTNVAIVTSNICPVYSDGKVFKAKVSIGTKVVEDARVVFKINGKVVKRTFTDEKGYAYLKINNLPGTYKISVVSLGKTVTKKLTVKHVVSLKTVTVRKSARKLTLTATLAKVNGKYLKYKTVTFKFNNNVYKAKTNSKGIAKVTVKSTVLSKLKVGKKVTYRATYLKDTVKKTVKVYG